jgi:hypothetical protein
MALDAWFGWLGFGTWFKDLFSQTLICNCGPMFISFGPYSGQIWDECKL